MGRTQESLGWATWMSQERSSDARSLHGHSVRLIGQRAISGRPFVMASARVGSVPCVVQIAESTGGSSRVGMRSAVLVKAFLVCLRECRSAAFVLPLHVKNDA